MYRSQARVFSDIPSTNASPAAVNLRNVASSYSQSCAIALIAIRRPSNKSNAMVAADRCFLRKSFASDAIRAFSAAPLTLPSVHCGRYTPAGAAAALNCCLSELARYLSANITLRDWRSFIGLVPFGGAIPCRLKYTPVDKLSARSVYGLEAPTGAFFLFAGVYSWRSKRALVCACMSFLYTFDIPLSRGSPIRTVAVDLRAAASLRRHTTALPNRASRAPTPPPTNDPTKAPVSILSSFSTPSTNPTHSPAALLIFLSEISHKFCTSHP
mmetsp:Transcript_14164/g.30501  ORF Transcript_14164/g.30501 Transcript_14164/m.30501 type:complete len:270 (+) Transcript_14164:2862-3671(+)